MRLCVAWLCGAALLLASFQAGAEPRRDGANGGHPAAVGTFIQWYLVKDWDDAKWRSEFRYMQEVGMRSLVFAPTADSKAHVTYYPTRLPGFQLAEGYPDLVDACLRNAEKAGIRVFLGLNFNDDWWHKSANDPAWLDAQMQEGNAVAAELYRRYAAKYPHAFAGWYWVWEVDNLNFRTPEQIRTLAQALDSNVRAVKALNPRLPVMLCPFMNASLGTPETYQAMWTAVFAQCSLGRGDIFCPQDCVGAGGLTLEQVPVWFAALKQAVATRSGLRFWADTETFQAESQAAADADHWIAAPLNRFVAQMKTEQPYVEQCLTFSYSHYYSPNTANSGFQRTYREYLRTGRLETVPPSAPAHTEAARDPKGRVVLSWEPATDNVGVCGYRLYRDGKQIHLMPMLREAVSDRRIKWTDTKAPRRTDVTYAIETYDFAGNLSPRVEIRVPPDPGRAADPPGRMRLP